MTVMKWADNCRIESGLIELVLAGKLCMSLEKDDIRFFIDPDYVAQETTREVEAFLKKHKT